MCQKDIVVAVATKLLQVERVGLAFYNAKRKNHLNDNAGSDAADKLDKAEFIVDIDFLKSLNPKETKEQDHYAVLGLANKRYKASDDEIRRAYRQMVLQHHPDKRKAKGEEVDQDKDYFTCITRAYEILGNAKCRQSFDSVDPQVDDTFPSVAEINKDFYGVFNKVFEANARWSEKPKVPAFGNADSTREEVDRFYSFWYDFKSWREFSYLDEEDKEKGQDRDERRWIEKENRAARIKRKKEEMARIRALVDLAYNNDKRIVKFKNEDKEKKLAAKRAKMDAAQAQKASQEQALREAQLTKERAEKAEQKRIEQLRIEKEQMKRALKKERKQLRDKAKEQQYFASDDKDRVKNMESIERICEVFSLLELQSLNKQMEEQQKKAAFQQALQTMAEKLRAEEELQQAKLKKNIKSDVKQVNKTELWSNENVQLLIKAFNLFPAGTAQRWEVIATFINQHSGNNEQQITARDVLNKAKTLQNSNFSKSSLKSMANDLAFESFEKNKREVPVCTDITINASSNGVAAATATMAVNGVAIDAGKPEAISNGVGSNGTQCSSNGGIKDNKQLANQAKTWSKDEQALLEQAIKTYPISTPDRWERIAECIPNRSKKDCLRRVKELVELVNTKKEAQQAAN